MVSARLPTPSFRARAWREFQLALDPLGRPRPLRAVAPRSWAPKRPYRPQKSLWVIASHPSSPRR
jgi:hypothetical protein